VDVETTGLDPERDRIIEIGAVRFYSGEPVESWTRLVRPDVQVPSHILRLTGISEEDLARSPEVGEVVADLYSFIGDAPVVGHNIAFDIDFLRRVTCASDPACGAGPALRSKVLLDTLALSRVFLPQQPSHALDALQESLGLPDTGRGHRAGPDAEASGRLLARIWSEALGRAPAVLRAASSWLEPAREQMPGTWGFVEGALRAASCRPQRQAEARPVSAPVSPAGDRRPVARGQAGPLVVGAFSRGGLFQAVVPGFEARPEQAEMAEAVLRCLGDGGVLAVEAGTGVGKSLAYLLPAVAVAERTGERVVVSTHTVTLQDQLMENDLPLVASALGRAVECAVLKGRTNYVCLRKWDEFLAGALVADEAERLFGLRMLMWLDETLTGDSAELNLGGRELDCWEPVAADDACWGTYCPRAGSCYVNRARERAGLADVIIANHSLVCSDLAAENRVLPPYQHLIIDEAHHFERVATEHLGLAADREHLASLLAGLHSGRRRRVPRGARTRPGIRGVLENAPAGAAGSLPDAAGQALSSVDRLYGAVGPAIGDPGDAQLSAYAGAGELRYGPGMSGLPEGALEAATQAAADIQAASKAGARLAAQLPPGDPGGLELGQIAHATALSGSAVEGLSRADRAGWVYWAERDRAGVRLRGVPVAVGEELKTRLWPNLRSVTAVSATLAVSGSFAHFLGAMGLDAAEGPPVETLLLRSPFDFERQVLLCLPSDLPLPEGPAGDRTYAGAVAGFLGALLPLTEGRALVLFTSHRLLRQVYALTASELGGRGLNLYGQGIDGGRSRLLRALRSEERAVVYGSSTFWEGVDVRGPQLSCLVITRLPFPRPDEPLVAARHERLAGMGVDPFWGYTLPAAVLRFKQGFGRLIRSSADRGVVVVLDGRLTRRRYGRVFASSVPRPTFCAAPSEQVLSKVREFLAGGDGADPAETSRRPGFVWRRPP